MSYSLRLNTCNLIRPGAPASRRLVVVPGTEKYSSYSIYFLWVRLLFLSALLIMCALATPAQQDTTALTLRQAVRLALQHNPALREAMGKGEAAQAGIQAARAALLPQVLLSSGVSNTSKVTDIAVLPDHPGVVLGYYNTWLNNLSAQQVIYSGGRLKALLRQATDEARAVEADNERTRQVVAYNAERAFLLLLTAQQEQVVAQDALNAAQDHLKVAQSRLAERAAPKYDVLRAEVEEQASEQDLVGATTDIQTAQASLQQALGGDEHNYRAVDPGLNLAAAPPPLDDELQHAKLQRPEMRALDWQQQAADAAIVAAKGLQQPTLSLGVGYQYASPESPLLLNRWLLTLSAALPIFDGGLAHAERHAAEARRTQVSAAQQELNATIVAEVKEAYARLTAACAQIIAARKQVELSEEMLRIANVRYDAGVATATEIADAQTSLTQSRQRLSRRAKPMGHRLG